MLHYRADCQPPLLQEVSVIPPKIIGTESIQTLASMLLKISYDSQIRTNRVGGIVAAHEFFAHPLDKLGHRDSFLCDPRYRRLFLDTRRKASVAPATSIQVGFGPPMREGQVDGNTREPTDVRRLAVPKSFLGK